MAQKAIIYGNAGAGSKVVFGSEASISANAGKPVNCGFEPKYIICTFQYQTGGGQWMQISAIYSADYSTGKFGQYYDNDGREVTMPNTTYLGLGTVDANGFTIVNPNYALRNVYWLATG